MKQFFTFLAAVLLTATTVAQVGINTETPDASAALDIVSTTGGLLVPRMTNVERQAISNPAAGLQVFVTDLNGGRFMFYDGTEWGTLSFTEKRPDAPTTVTATGGNAQATVSFTAPSSNGGSEITSYTATSSPDDISATVTQAGSGDITVTGLTNETAYTFTVTATNAIGTSVASAASNSVTPVEPIVPDAPTIVTATAGNAQATVSYTAPSSNGGSAITSYTATSSPGDITAAVNQAGSGDITVTGLTNDTSYTFTVTATNAIGTSVASAASNSVTPASALAIGDIYQGGVVFYLDGNGGGLIAAPSDQSCCSNWNTAVSLCSNLTLGGYSDWFLPSKDELNLMYLYIGQGNTGILGNVGNFSDNYYWSSTEDDINYAWLQNFFNGFQGGYDKTNSYYVRAVRAF